MVNKFIKIANHRDFVLLLAIAVGLALGPRTAFLGDISVWVLAGVMVFSTVGFSFSHWRPFKYPFQHIYKGLFLNYVVFGGAIILLSLLLPKGDDYDHIRMGLIIIAAAPAGPSIVAFTTLLKGNVTYSLNGVFGITLAAVGVTPLLIWAFLGNTGLSPWILVSMLLKLIVLPVILSRFLRHKRILPTVKKIQGTVVKWGFFLVIVPTIGLSRDVIFREPMLVLIIALIFLVVIYGFSFGYYLLMKKRRTPEDLISEVLLMVIKSSAFSAVIALNFFDQAIVALPSAVLSIFVTTFYITFSLFSNRYLVKV